MYQDLIAENIQNPNIKEFSFDKNVLDEIILEEDTLNIIEDSTTTKCNEDGAGGDQSGCTYYAPYSVIYNTTNVNITYTPTYRYKIKCDYNKYGIYFSMFSQIIAEKYNNTSGTWDPWLKYYTDLKIEWQRRYKPRCQTEKGWSSGTSSCSSNYKLVYSAYSGSTALYKYHLISTFKQSSTNTVFGTYGIKRNY